MTIKITRDVNLDEKSIQIKDDKLTVHVSDNPNNRLVKTQNGLEVLPEANDWINIDVLYNYIKNTYGEDYSVLNGHISLYNTKFKYGKSFDTIENIYNNEYIQMDQSKYTVEYTLSNKEILNKEQFDTKYYNNLTDDNFKFVLDKYYYPRQVKFLVGDLVVKFTLPKSEFKYKFDKDILLQPNFLTQDIIKDVNFMYHFHVTPDGYNNKRTFGYKSFSKEATEDDQNYYLTLTFDKYMECTKVEEESFDYQESYSNTLNNLFRPFLVYFRFAHTEKLKVDPKYDIPVILYVTYYFTN